MVKACPRILGIAILFSGFFKSLAQQDKQEESYGKNLENHTRYALSQRYMMTAVTILIYFLDVCLYCKLISIVHLRLIFIIEVLYIINRIYE